MSMTWLGNVEADTAWAHAPWTRFSDVGQPERQLALLPVTGFADHGLGVCLDAEEIVGAEIIHRAMLLTRTLLPTRVMPPMRFGVAPTPFTFFGVDPETAYDLLLEIGQSVRAGGFSKLVFLITSPWQEELVKTAAVDLRAATGLRTYNITLAGLGLDFHPRSASRAQLQAIVAHLTRTSPTTARPGQVVDPTFRPGRWQQPPAVEPQPGIDADALLEAGARRLAALLAEIDAHTGSREPQCPIVELPAQRAERRADAPLAWPANRSRYLPALTRDALEAIPDKHRALVVLPTGAIEQHGPHLPVGVDALLGQALLDVALPQLPPEAPVWVAPPVTYGKSNEHADFPGTVTVSARSLHRLLLALARQLHSFGFRKIGILNTHGGNSTVLVYTLRELQSALDLRAGLITNPFRPPLSPQESRFGFHAGEWETALMMAAARELVHPDLAVCEYPSRHDAPGNLHPEDAPATFAWLTRDISSSGVMGDATAATEDNGRAWLASASSGLAQKLLELTSQE